MLKDANWKDSSNAWWIGGIVAQNENNTTIESEKNHDLNLI